MNMDRTDQNVTRHDETTHQQESPTFFPAKRYKRTLPTIREIARDNLIISRFTSIDRTIARQISEERQQTEGYVYFVRCGEYIKIGYTSDPNTRMSKFRTNNPYVCELVAIMKGGRIREAEIQRQFSEHLHRGEWYRLHESIAVFIKDLASSSAD